MTPVALVQAGLRLVNESCLALIGQMLPDPAAPNRDEFPNRSVRGNESVRCRVRAGCSQIIGHAGVSTGTHVAAAHPAREPERRSSRKPCREFLHARPTDQRAAPGRHTVQTERPARQRLKAQSNERQIVDRKQMVKSCWLALSERAGHSRAASGTLVKRGWHDSCFIFAEGGECHRPGLSNWKLTPGLTGYQEDQEPT